MKIDGLEAAFEDFSNERAVKGLIVFIFLACSPSRLIWWISCQPLRLKAYLMLIDAFLFTLGEYSVQSKSLMGSLIVHAAILTS